MSIDLNSAPSHHLVKKGTGGDLEKIKQMRKEHYAEGNSGIKVKNDSIVEKAGGTRLHRAFDVTEEKDGVVIRPQMYCCKPSNKESSDSILQRIGTDKLGLPAMDDQYHSAASQTKDFFVNQANMIQDPRSWEKDGNHGRGRDSLAVANGEKKGWDYLTQTWYHTDIDPENPPSFYQASFRKLSDDEELALDVSVDRIEPTTVALLAIGSPSAMYGVTPPTLRTG